MSGIFEFKGLNEKQPGEKYEFISMRNQTNFMKSFIVSHPTPFETTKQQKQNVKYLFNKSW